MKADKKNFKEEIDKIVANYKDNPKESTIAILQDTQEVLGHLDKEYLEYISDETGIPIGDLYSVATFYTQFSTKPVGKHMIHVCEGTSCHVMGNRRNKSRLRKLLGIDVGETTKNLRFTLESVRCLGCCALAPVIKVDDDTHGRMRPDKLEGILERYE